MARKLKELKELKLRQFEFHGMPTRHAERRASQAFGEDALILMGRVTEGDIDADLANRIMAAPQRRLLVDFMAARQWNPRIKGVHDSN